MGERSIAEIRDGSVGRVVGAVRAAGPPLRSPLGERPCVYWDVREGLGREPKDRDGRPFWLEDVAGDRVLVMTDALVVEVRAHREKAVLDAVDADVAEVAARIRALKLRLREPNAPSDVLEERKHLAKVATLLCALRAHARGNLHVGGSLPEQEHWIRTHAHLTKDQPGDKAVGLMVERWEVVIEEGQHLVVEGLFRVEPLPPGLGSGGYRDRPNCMVVRASERSPVRVLGVGISAPQSPEDATPAGGVDGDSPSPWADPITRWTAAIVTAVAGFVWWLTH